MKKYNHNDLSALGNKIAHKSLTKSVSERFEQADQVLGTDNESIRQSREKIIRKSHTLTEQDIDNIEKIKSRCLEERRVVLNDSHVIRIALLLASKLNVNELVHIASEVPKLKAGRPRIE